LQYIEHVGQILQCHCVLTADGNFSQISYLRYGLYDDLSLILPYHPPSGLSRSAIIIHIV